MGQNRPDKSPANGGNYRKWWGPIGGQAALWAAGLWRELYCELFNHLKFPKVEVWACRQLFCCVSSSSCSFLVFDYHNVFKIRPQTHYMLVLISSSNEKTHMYRLTSADVLCLLSHLMHAHNTCCWCTQKTENKQMPFMEDLFLNSLLWFVL